MMSTEQNKTINTEGQSSTEAQSEAQKKTRI